MFSKPNSLLVLRDSTDGDKRAKALRALHEPKQSGGARAFLAQPDVASR